MIILTAGIDLSIGAIAVLGTIMMAKNAGGSGATGALPRLAPAGLRGHRRGQRQARHCCKLPPFIVTLGTYTVVVGRDPAACRVGHLSGEPKVADRPRHDVRDRVRCGPRGRFGVLVVHPLYA